MAGRNNWMIWVICAGLSALGEPSNAAAWPANLPDNTHLTVGESTPVGESTLVSGLAPLPPATEIQSSHATQPENSTASEQLFANPVSAETLVQYAMANNPEIQAARHLARAMQARVPQAGSLGDPQLMTTTFLDSLETAAGAQDVMMSLSQRFPWFGKRNLRSTVADHEAMAACSRLATVELEVIERIKLAYFELAFVQKSIEETRKLEPWLADVLAVARTKYQTSSGRSGLESVLQVQVESAKLKTRLLQLEQSQRAAQARLNAELHLSPQTSLEPETLVRRDEIAHTADVLMELAESSQPELDVYRREIERDRSKTELARRQYWPDVTLSLNWHAIDSAGLSPVATGDDAYSVGMGVNLPIRRKRLGAAVREAQHKTSHAARRYTARRDKLRAEIEILNAKFIEQQQVLGILQSEILPLAERTLELVTEGYRHDRVEFQQLIDTYRTLLDYRIDYHRRAANRQQQMASLERAVGCAITEVSTEQAPGGREGA